MNKGPGQKVPIATTSRFRNSTFTITFAVEILGLDVWHDCNEGWLDLGPCIQGIKMQYQLYPGQNFDVDILIWPHVAKIWCGPNYGWVRTWQLLERRFLAFSIRHKFPARVMELRNYTASITPAIGLASLGSTAKNDKNVEVYLPPLKFGEKRYFAPVLDRNETLKEFVTELIWEIVNKFIPTSNLDGIFNIPMPVTDIRHQDTIIYQVKESILNKKVEPIQLPAPEETRSKDKKESRIIKEKDKEKKKAPDVAKVKFEMKLTGSSLLAGVGRIAMFEKTGDRPNDLGEITAIISSTNLPAQDDYPILFVNVDTLFDVPSECLNQLRISKLYTKWTIGTEVHDSEMFDVKRDIHFNDHYAFPLQIDTVSKITATFLDNPFEIQLRGIRSTFQNQTPQFFGYKKGDQNFGTISSYKLDDPDTDFLIAVTHINAKHISKGMNMFLRGDYPLFPPKVNTIGLNREGICTNDVNHIKAPINPHLLVPNHVVLQSQMTLGVSMGFVGCQPKKLSESFARMFCLIQDTAIVMTIIKYIEEINDSVMQSNSPEDALTGFALDVGSTAILYVEGPSEGQILKIWDMTEDFYPKVKPVYSSSNRYASRIYPDSQMSVPFHVLKMFAPLAVILACPPVYVRPALPLPTRSALLKLGLLVTGKLRVVPSRNDMPSAEELKSFRLELCVAPKPALFQQVAEDEATTICGHDHQNITSLKINCDKQNGRKDGNEEK